MVEKIDLVGLYVPIAREYRIPITNGRGWSDINTRYDIAVRCAKYGDRRKVILETWSTRKNAVRSPM